MKGKISIFIVLSTFLCSCSNSCKSVDTPHLSISYLSGYQWHLISTTNSDPAIPIYKGTTADSMRFTWKWAYNGDQLVDSIYYYKNGNVNKYAGISYVFGIITTGGPNNFNYSDTITFAPSWKSGYNNKLIIHSITNNYLVFAVENSNGTNWETDSLHY